MPKREWRGDAMKNKMTQKEALEIFRWAKAELEGHFVYTNGRHGKDYVNKDAIYPHPVYIHRLCKGLVSRFGKRLVNNIEIVVAPAVGGVILSRLVADYLQQETNCGIFSVYIDKEQGGQFIIRRGYDKFINDHNVFILDDVMTTGGTVKKLIAEARAKGAQVIGVAVLWNRGGITAADLGVPRLISLIKKPLESWNEADCPLCKKGIPVNQDVGKGKDFLIRQVMEDLAKAANLAAKKVFEGEKKK